MQPTTATLPLPTIPSDVQKFADEQGIAEYLPAVVAMTRRIFPDRPIHVLLEADPEIADLWFLVLEVDTNGMEVEEMLATHNQWTGEIIEHCPSTHVHFFCIAQV